MELVADRPATFFFHLPRALESRGAPLRFDFDASPTGLRLHWEEGQSKVRVQHVQPGSQAESMVSRGIENTPTRCRRWCSPRLCPHGFVACLVSTGSRRRFRACSHQRVSHHWSGRGAFDALGRFTACFVLLLPTSRCTRSSQTPRVKMCAKAEIDDGSPVQLIVRSPWRWCYCMAPDDESKGTLWVRNDRHLHLLLVTSGGRPLVCMHQRLAQSGKVSRMRASPSKQVHRPVHVAANTGQSGMRAWLLPAPFEVQVPAGSIPATVA